MESSGKEYGIVTESKAAKPIGNNLPRKEPGQAAEAGAQTVMSVRRAIDEARKLYTSGKLEAASKLISQVVAARPRLSGISASETNWMT